MSEGHHAPPRVLDLQDEEYDPGDGVVLATRVSQLRAMAREGPLLLRNCPQMLAHTLYKAGLLEGKALIVERETLRDEEPYG